MEITYSRLLHQMLQEQGINLTRLHKNLYDLGLDITYSSLYSYFTGVVVPPYSTAKEILKTEKMAIKNDDLEEILEYSKKVSRNEKGDEQKVLNLNLKIKPEYINQEYKRNANVLKSVIEMRADELFGDEDLITQFSASGKRKLSAYIAYLVKKDLEESGFIESEDDE